MDIPPDAAHGGSDRATSDPPGGVTPAADEPSSVAHPHSWAHRFSLFIEVMASTWRGRLAIVGLVAIIAAAAYLLQDHINWTNFSYPAVAGAVLLASGGLVVPVPALAITCTTATFLNPAAVAIIAGLAGTLGELTGYFLGFSGSGVFERRRLYLRVESWMRKRGWLLLFVISAVPNPLFDVAGIAAGALRYPLWRYLVAVGLGKLVKFFIIAYSCHYSLQGLKGVFGV